MIRCLAVDDELLSLELLEDNIRRIPFLQLAGLCSSAYEAMGIMHKEQIDLVFLDIQMGGISGTQFVQGLSGMASKPMIIFVTAYKKYALEGFELDVLDYLVKPVAFERFLKAVNKAAAVHALQQTQAAPVPALPVASDYFFVNVGYDLMRIEVDQVCYIEGLKDYIKIFVTGSDTPVITRLSMKAIAERLPAARFNRVHKSFIIAIDKISSIRKNRIYIGQHIIPVSDSHRTELFTLIESRNLKG